jgi:hypothetical protein
MPNCLSRKYTKHAQLHPQAGIRGHRHSQEGAVSSCQASSGLRGGRRHRQEDQAQNKDSLKFVGVGASAPSGNVNAAMAAAFSPESTQAVALTSVVTPFVQTARAGEARENLRQHFLQGGRPIMIIDIEEYDALLAGTAIAPLTSSLPSSFGSSTPASFTPNERETVHNQSPTRKRSASQM